MKLIIVFILSLFLVGCKSEPTYIDDLVDEHIISNNNEISVYSDVYLYDLFSYNDVTIDSKNMLVDTTKLGINESEIEYTYNGKKYLHKINYNVVDNEAPRYLGGTNKTVTKGYDKDICDLVFYGDNYDGDLKCEITGNYDVNKVGTYKLVYTITDSSNNTTDINVTLNVVEKSNSSSSSSNTNKIYFQDVVAKHKNENTEIGIDVSKWQGDIDFEKVKAAGATFVMMRIGVQTKQHGELSVDSYYEQNIK